VCLAACRSGTSSPTTANEHAEHETLHWIGFYNEERLHEELGDLPPVEYAMINYKKDNTPTLSARQSSL
jgi:transposase InsO family protein